LRFGDVSIAAIVDARLSLRHDGSSRQRELGLTISFA
jgi:hypothetical protein